MKELNSLFPHWHPNCLGLKSIPGVPGAIPDIIIYFFFLVQGFGHYAYSHMQTYIHTYEPKYRLRKIHIGKQVLQFRVL